MPPIPGATNVYMDVEHPVVMLSIDLTKSGAASASGKSTTVASTFGNKSIGSTGVSLGLNAFRKHDLTLPSDDEEFKAPEGLKNITMELRGSILKLSVDLSKDCGPSSTGKTTIVASTSGNKAIGSTGVMLGLNMFSYKKAKITAEALATAPKAQTDGTTGATEGLQGVEVIMSGDICTFTINTAKGLWPSKSGKATILATSNGFKQVPGTDTTCNLMVCKAIKSEGPAPEVPEAPLEGVKNVTCGVIGPNLLIKCDLSQTQGLSSTGKSTMIAQTSGLKSVPGTTISVNLNLFQAIGGTKRPVAGIEGPPAKKLKTGDEQELKAEDGKELKKEDD